jgi:hypothetical protein
MANKHGFPYRTIMGMLIFAVQIGRFDIAPDMCILCNFNERPSVAHFQAVKNVIKYLRDTSRRSLIYWRPTGRERHDLPIGDIIPVRPERGISDKFPTDFPPVEPVCFVEASYDGLLPIGEHLSITGIFICLSGTAIFSKTAIQKTTSLSSTEAEVIACFAAGKIIKYFWKVFFDLRFPLTQPTPVGDKNAGTISIANHNLPSGRTRHPDLQNFASQEWVHRGLMKFFKIYGTGNPSNAMSKVLYRILFFHRFGRLQGYFGSPYSTHLTFIDNPNDNTTPGLLYQHQHLHLHTSLTYFFIFMAATTSPTNSGFLDFIFEIFHLFHNAAVDRFMVLRFSPYRWGGAADGIYWIL